MSECSRQLFANNAISILAQNLSPTELEIYLTSGFGDLFPNPLAGEWFLVTLETIEAPFVREIVKVVERNGDILIIDPLGRAQENTTARAWVANQTIVDNRVTAGTLRCLQRTVVSNFGDVTHGSVIPAASTANVSSMDISGSNKSCKWMVTIETADDKACMIEISAVYKNTGPIWSRYSKVGDNISVDFDVQSAGNFMTLAVHNTHTHEFNKVDVMRLQHYA